MNDSSAPIIKYAWHITNQDISVSTIIENIKNEILAEIRALAEGGGNSNSDFFTPKFCIYLNCISGNKFYSKVCFFN